MTAVLARGEGSADTYIRETLSPSQRKEARLVPAPTADTRTECPRHTNFGEVRLQGFISKPEIQKGSQSQSDFNFVNGTADRARLIQHGVIEAYRKFLPPTVCFGEYCVL